MKQIILLAFLLISHFTMARRPAVEPVFILGQEEILADIKKSIPINLETKSKESSSEMPLHFLLALGIFLPFGIWYGAMNSLTEKKEEVKEIKKEETDFPKAS